jgi:hypothetical protein
MKHCITFINSNEAGSKSVDAGSFRIFEGWVYLHPDLNCMAPPIAAFREEDVLSVEREDSLADEGALKQNFSNHILDGWEAKTPTP